MQGNLNDVLPELVSEENVRYLEALIKRKVTTAAGIAVRLLHAMDAHFGPEARDVLSEMTGNIQIDLRAQLGDPKEDLKAFCNKLDFSLYWLSQLGANC